jgi:hypothetical protein
VHVLLRGGVQPRHRWFAASFLFLDLVTSTPSPQSDFRHLYAIDAILLRRGHWRVTSTPSPRQSELREIPPQHAIAAISDPRRRLARRQRRDHRPHVLRRLGLRPGPRLVHARDRGQCFSHHPVRVEGRLEGLCFAVSFVSLLLFVLGPPRSVLCHADFTPLASSAESVPRTRGRSERASPRRRRRRRRIRRGKSATAAPTTGGDATVMIFVSNRTQLSRT